MTVAATAAPAPTSAANAFPASLQATAVNPAAGACRTLPAALQRINQATPLEAEQQAAPAARKICHAFCLLECRRARFIERNAAPGSANTAPSAARLLGASEGVCSRAHNHNRPLNEEYLRHEQWSLDTAISEVILRNLPTPSTLVWAESATGLPPGGNRT
jgi:hypothetical protein